MRVLPGVGLGDVMTSAAAAVGVPGFRDALGVGETTCAVVCLVDGLGASAIEDHGELFPSFRDAEGGWVQAPFPSTTATGLATLGTGLHPGRHGMLGASFWLPDIQEVLTPLRWGSSPSPHAVQPEATVFERADGFDIDCLSVGPSAYAHSGLTRAAFRGADYLDAENIEQRAAVIARAAKGRHVIYVYWPNLDRAGHEHGVESDEWRAAASEVNELIDTLRSALPGNGRLIVTADHGMQTVTERLWMEGDHRLMMDVDAVAGEPRARFLYTAHVDDVLARWTSVLDGRARILTREGAVSEGLFGEVHPDMFDRIGDLVVLPSEGVIVGSHSFDPLLSSLAGQHGGLTDVERRIPALILG